MPAKTTPAHPPAYLLQGQDDRLKRRALQELLDRLVDPDGRDFDLEHLDVDSAPAEAVLTALGSLPLFSNMIIREYASSTNLPRTSALAMILVLVMVLMLAGGAALAERGKVDAG